MANDLTSRAFLYRERARGTRLDFREICREAGMINVVSTTTPPDVRLHDEPEDWIVALPGKRHYVLAEGKLPEDRRERATMILERLAYGAHDWASREVVLAHRRRQRDESAPKESPDDVERRRVLAETLPMRRIIRRDPGASDETIAGSLGKTVETVKIFRASLKGLSAR